MRKINLHWGMGQFDNFRLFGSVPYMQDKIRQFEFCIEYIQKNYGNITENDEEEIQIYKSLIRIYERRIREMR